jgi:hypothetical protein
MLFLLHKNFFVLYGKNICCFRLMNITKTENDMPDKNPAFEAQPSISFLNFPLPELTTAGMAHSVQSHCSTYLPYMSHT